MEGNVTYVNLLKVGVGRYLPFVTAMERNVLRADTELRLKEGDRRLFEADARAFAQRVVNSLAERLSREINTLMEN
jgi:hypothetical protein